MGPGWCCEKRRVVDCRSLCFRAFVRSDLRFAIILLQVTCAKSNKTHHAGYHDSANDESGRLLTLQPSRETVRRPTTSACFGRLSSKVL